MERYDMYCQVCDRNIYNALVDWMFREHYCCPQSIENRGLIKRAYPRTQFKVVFENRKIKGIILYEDGLPEDYTTSLKTHIRTMFENNGGMVHVIDGTGRGMSVDSIKIWSKTFFENFSFDNGEFVARRKHRGMDLGQKAKETKRKPRFPQSLSGMITWYEYDKEDEYYEKAKLIRHRPHPKNGSHINDHNICPECAQKLGFKCDLCRRKLKKETH
jgi:hypothetical protein